MVSYVHRLRPLPCTFDPSPGHPAVNERGPIPGRPLKAHSIKRVAFIPSIFTRDVSSSAAGFLAIRVTVVSAISTCLLATFSFFLSFFLVFPRNRKVTPASFFVLNSMETKRKNIVFVSRLQFRKEYFLCFRNQTRRLSERSRQIIVEFFSVRLFTIRSLSPPVLFPCKPGIRILEYN